MRNVRLWAGFLLFFAGILVSPNLVFGDSASMEMPHPQRLALPIAYTFLELDRVFSSKSERKFIFVRRPGGSRKSSGTIARDRMRARGYGPTTAEEAERTIRILAEQGKFPIAKKDFDEDKDGNLESKEMRDFRNLLKLGIEQSRIEELGLKKWDFTPYPALADVVVRRPQPTTLLRTPFFRSKIFTNPRFLMARGHKVLERLPNSQSELSPISVTKSGLKQKAKLWLKAKQYLYSASSY